MHAQNKTKQSLLILAVLSSTFYSLLCASTNAQTTRKVRPKYHIYDREINWSSSTPSVQVPLETKNNDDTLFEKINPVEDAGSGDSFGMLQLNAQPATTSPSRKRAKNENQKEDNWLLTTPNETSKKRSSDTDWGWLAEEVQDRKAEKEKHTMLAKDQEADRLAEENVYRSARTGFQRNNGKSRANNLGMDRYSSKQMTPDAPFSTFSSQTTPTTYTDALGETKENQRLSDWEKDLGLQERLSASPTYGMQKRDYQAGSKKNYGGTTYRSNTRKNEYRANNTDRSSITSLEPRGASIPPTSSFLPSTFASEPSTFSSSYNTPSSRTSLSPSSTSSGWNTGIENGASFSSGSRLDTFRQLHKSGSSLQPLGGSSSSWAR